MDMERVELHGAVREGYQILLRADATLLLPQAYERIATYYRALGQACMDWILDVYGECVRGRFLALEDVRDMARFGTCRYRFSMKCTWETDAYAAFLCETELIGDGVEDALRKRRAAQVWSLEGEQILPVAEVRRLLGVPKRVHPPFSPDGVCLRDGALIFYKNPTARSTEEEWRFVPQK